MTIQEILRKIYLQYKLSPLDAEILLSLAIKRTKEYILAHPEKKLTAAQRKKFKSFAERRFAGEPIAYITGQKEFFGLDFTVNKNVLIPRPETELLVEEAIKKINSSLLSFPPPFHEDKLQRESRKCFNCDFQLDPCFRRDDKLTVVDIGTGSGNIIISIAKNIPADKKRKLNLYAVDISNKSLRVAKANAKKHNVLKIIKFVQSDLLDYFLKNKIKLENILILANLPYLDKKWKNLRKSSESKELKFEPKIALAGGSDGLDVYKELAKRIKSLKAQNKRINIAIYCEIGHIQKKGMQSIFSFAQKINFHKDLAGKWRVAEITINQ